MQLDELAEIAEQMHEHQHGCDHQPCDGTAILRAELASGDASLVEVRDQLEATVDHTHSVELCELRKSVQLADEQPGQNDNFVIAHHADQDLHQLA